MTKAMRRKAVEAINEFRKEHVGIMVYGWGFHHYGEDYRIEEIEDNKFLLFRCCKTDIHDTLVETFSI